MFLLFKKKKITFMFPSFRSLHVHLVMSSTWEKNRTRPHPGMNNHFLSLRVELSFYKQLLLSCSAWRIEQHRTCLATRQVQQKRNKKSVLIVLDFPAIWCQHSMRIFFFFEQQGHAH